MYLIICSSMPLLQVMHASIGTYSPFVWTVFGRSRCTWQSKVRFCDSCRSCRRAERRKLPWRFWWGKAHPPRNWAEFAESSPEDLSPEKRKQENLLTSIGAWCRTQEYFTVGSFMEGGKYEETWQLPEDMEDHPQVTGTQQGNLLSHQHRLGHLCIRWFDWWLNPW